MDWGRLAMTSAPSPYRDVYGFLLRESQLLHKCRCTVSFSAYLEGMVWQCYSAFLYTLYFSDALISKVLTIQWIYFLHASKYIWNWMYRQYVFRITISWSSSNIFCRNTSCYPTSNSYDNVGWLLLHAECFTLGCLMFIQKYVIYDIFVNCNWVYNRWQ
jgi:hypothetical protein